MKRQHKPEAEGFKKGLLLYLRTMPSSTGNKVKAIQLLPCQRRLFSLPTTGADQRGEKRGVKINKDTQVKSQTQRLRESPPAALRLSEIGGFLRTKETGRVTRQGHGRNRVAELTFQVEIQQR